MINWPKSLITEIAARRCIFFIGAGVSATARDNAGRTPKDWESFINAATDLLCDVPYKDSVNEIIASKNFLLALQGIKKEVDHGDYRTLLDDEFNHPAYEASDLHKTIFDLDVRIVVTTNFDKIYENYCHAQSTEGYKVICYDSTSLVDEIRSDNRLIIKAHGSINDINKMIFTRSEYHKAKRDYPHFYEVLKALFITNTVLFIGCGLNDPDVCLLLEEVKDIGSPAKPHYVLVKKGSHNKIAREDWRDTFNVTALEFGPDFLNLVQDFQELLNQVNSIRATVSSP